MTWEAIRPHLGSFLTAILSIALGVGGTVGVQAVRAPEAPKAAQSAPPQTFKAEVSCVIPAGDIQVLEELRLFRNEMEKQRTLLGRAAAECRAAGKSPLLEIFK